MSKVLPSWPQRGNDPGLRDGGRRGGSWGPLRPDRVGPGGQGFWPEGDRRAQGL